MEEMEDVKFGVLLLGAPGAGKTTFSKALHTFFQEHLNRTHCMVNLDPANENLEFASSNGASDGTLALDVRDLITLDDVMEEYKLGPNGAMIYCAEFLEANF